MFSRLTSPPVIAPAIRYVTQAILSQITEYSQGLSFSFPLIVITLSPAPYISPPHLLRKSQRSIISGSLAALTIVVVPFAVTDAKIAFSVAPTLGNENVIFLPIRPSGAVQMSLP